MTRGDRRRRSFFGVADVARSDIIRGAVGTAWVVEAAWLVGPV